MCAWGGIVPILSVILSESTEDEGRDALKPLHDPLRLATYTPISPADVIVFREGEYVVTVDGKTKEVIARSTDHAEVILKAIDNLPLVTDVAGETVRRGRIYFAPGIYNINRTIEIVDARIALVGADWRSVWFVPTEDIGGPLFKIYGTYHWSTGFRLEHIYIDADEKCTDCLEIGDNVYNVHIHFVKIRRCGKHIINAINGASHHDWFISDSEFEDSKSGVDIRNGYYLIFHNNYIHGITNNHGLLLGSIDRGVVTGNIVSLTGVNGIYVMGSNDIVVAGNYVGDTNTESRPEDVYGNGIAVWSTFRFAIVGNVIRRLVTSSNMKRYVYVGGGSSDGIIEGNIGYGAMVEPYHVEGTNIRVGDNTGFGNRNSGVATITAGSTRVTVSHGLVKAPRIILLTPANNARVWYDNVTDTSFDIVTDTAPSADLDVAWYAEV